MFKYSSYEDIYNKYFVKMPEINSTCWLVVWILLGLLDVGIATEGFTDNYCGILEFLVGHKAYTSAVLAAAVWLVVAFIGFFVIRDTLRISVSHKIVMIDRLAQIRDK